MFDKKEIKVNKDVEQYLKYLDHKKFRIKVPQSLKDFMKESGIYFSIAAVLGVVAILLHESLSLAPQPPAMLNVYGIKILAFIPSMLLICIGISWVFHGFGFIIIRR